MRLKTRLFELKSMSMSGLAVALGLSLSQVYRIKQGKRRIGEQFIIGALTTFPEYGFDDLFYISEGR